MRRLPVFLVVDVSESMVGKPLQNVSEGIKQIIVNLRSNPMALETAYISVITFAGKAKTLVPLTDVLKFNFPDLFIGGGTSLGGAVLHLMKEIDDSVIRTTFEIKGDWKPIVFLLTDGIPTDDYASVFNRWNQLYRKRTNLICIGIGNQADLKALKQISDEVFLFNQTDPSAYKQFFKWISSSIESRSSGESTEKMINDNVVLEINDNSKIKPPLKDDTITLLARCENSKLPYLIKYSKGTGKVYNLENVFTLNEEYFSLTDSEETLSEVNTSEITDYPECPGCGATFYAYCHCGRLYCFTNPEFTVCPWCGDSAKIVFQDNFNIKRNQG